VNTSIGGELARSYNAMAKLGLPISISLPLKHGVIQRIRAQNSASGTEFSNFGKDHLRGSALERGPGRNGLVAALTMHQRVIEKLCRESDRRTCAGGTRKSHDLSP
jgi:hypothetical protein